MGPSRSAGGNAWDLPTQAPRGSYAPSFSIPGACCCHPCLLRVASLAAPEPPENIIRDCAGMRDADLSLETHGRPLQKNKLQEAGKLGERKNIGVVLAKRARCINPL